MWTRGRWPPPVCGRWPLCTVPTCLAISMCRHVGQFSVALFSDDDDDDDDVGVFLGVFGVPCVFQPLDVHPLFPRPPPPPHLHCYWRSSIPSSSQKYLEASPSCLSEIPDQRHGLIPSYPHTLIPSCPWP